MALQGLRCMLHGVGYSPPGRRWDGKGPFQHPLHAAGEYLYPEFVTEGEEAALLHLVDHEEPAWKDSNFNGRHRSALATPAMFNVKQLQATNRTS